MSRHTNWKDLDHKGSRKWIIRENDYYGGDLWVQLAQRQSYDIAAEVVWSAWGEYGGATIQIQSAAEARSLAAALTEAATAIDSQYPNAADLPRPKDASNVDVEGAK